MASYQDPIARAYVELCEAIDNGPAGRVKTDDIKYGQTKNLTGYAYSKPELNKINDEKVADRKARQEKEKWYNDYADRKAEIKKARNDHTKVTLHDYHRAFESIPDIDPSDEAIKVANKYGITHDAAIKGLNAHAQTDGYKDFWDAHTDQMHNYHEVMADIARK